MKSVLISMAIAGLMGTGISAVVHRNDFDPATAQPSAQPEIVYVQVPVYVPAPAAQPQFDVQRYIAQWQLNDLANDLARQARIAQINESPDAINAMRRATAAEDAARNFETSE